MLFNSNVFLQFLAAFLLLYSLCRHHLRARNFLILAASYLFYGWWDYRFLALLFLTSLLDYAVGRRLDAVSDPRTRKFWVTLSVAGNLGALGFFKYCNFFVDSFLTLLAALGFHADPHTWTIILPVGISFYTFQSMSYTLDVYRRQAPATRDLLNFLAYVAFFPQLVAGPIERARSLLPQFESTRLITLTHVREGAWLILWGLFKKVAIADNLAPLVELAYDHPAPTASLVCLGTVAFALQIYCDFSGYSDIARGVARWLGFELMVNFNLPYLAASPREFWQRWHISLSTWLRDYLYVSLGGNRRGEGRTRLNLMLTMVLGGLWHGAALNFILWGVWHGLALVLTRPPRGVSAREPRVWQRGLAWAGTFLVVLYGWLLFRAGSWERIVTLTGALAVPGHPDWMGSFVLSLVLLAIPLVAIQGWQARTGDLLAPAHAPVWCRAILQGGMLVAIVLFWQRDAAPFIYFQF